MRYLAVLLAVCLPLEVLAVASKRREVVFCSQLLGEFIHTCFSHLLFVTMKRCLGLRSGKGMAGPFLGRPSHLVEFA